jgi:hypothetical protein
MAFDTVSIKGGPLDGQPFAAARGVNVYWVMPDLRLMPNAEEITYEEIKAAIGAYSRHTKTEGRRTITLLLWRGNGTGQGRQ